MNSDCAFWIGKTHRVCQDYALALTGEAESQVILADGCSSSPDTDFGARLLAKAAQPLLPDLSPDNRAGWQSYHERAVRRAAGHAQRLGLRIACLDATLMTIKATEGAFAACCYGDGVVALGRRDGGVEVYVIGFAANCPQYASYLRDAPRRRLWEAQPGNVKSVQRWELGRSDPEDRQSQGAFELFTGQAADYRFVAVLSDGVQSFAREQCTDTSRTPLSITVDEVLTELLAFKGGHGQFVQRRAQAFRKECRSRGWHHADDVSLGVVWLED